MDKEQSSKEKDIDNSIRSENKPECKREKTKPTSNEGREDSNKNVGSQGELEKALQLSMHCTEKLQLECKANFSERSNPKYLDIGVESRLLQNLDNIYNKSISEHSVGFDENVSGRKTSLAQTPSFDTPGETSLESKISSFQISSDKNTSENKSLSVIFNIKSGEGASEGSALLPAIILFNDNVSRTLHSEGTESSLKLPENFTKSSSTRQQKKATRKQKNLLPFKISQNKGYDFQAASHKRKNLLPFKSSQNKGYNFQAASHTQIENAPFEWKSNSSRIFGSAITDEISSDTKDSLTQISSEAISDLTNSGNEENLSRKRSLEITDESVLVSKLTSLYIFNAVSSDEPVTKKSGLMSTTFLVPEDVASLNSSLRLISLPVDETASESTNIWEDLDEDTLKSLAILSSDCMSWLPKLSERAEDATNKTNNGGSKLHPGANPEDHPSDISEPFRGQTSPGTETKQITEYLPTEPRSQEGTFSDTAMYIDFGNDFYLIPSLDYWVDTNNSEEENPSGNDEEACEVVPSEISVK